MLQIQHEVTAWERRLFCDGYYSGSQSGEAWAHSIALSGIHCLRLCLGFPAINRDSVK